MKGFITLIKKVNKLLFVCPWDEPTCSNGCKCGKMGGGKSKAEEGISQAGATAYERGKQTPQEESQYKQSFELGKLIEQLQKYQLGLAGAPQGLLSPTEQYLQEGGELGKALYEQTLTEAKDPYAYYESTLQPQLQLAEDYINRQAQKRGLLRSGIPIEQMGRAGVELAIQEANARQQARANALQRTAGLTEYISGTQANRLAQLSNLYGTQQQAGLGSMQRQAGQAQTAAQYQAYPYQARLGQAYAGNPLLGAAGTIGGGIIGGMVGGPMGAAVGAGIGGSLGGINV